MCTKKVNKWLVIRDGREATADVVDAFVRELRRAANGKGLELEAPTKLSISQSTGNGQHLNAKAWKEFFEKHVQDANFEYIMLIDNKYDDTHGLLKFFEVFYKIPTQQVTLEIARQVIGIKRRQTLENIINKFNCKHFGTNYEPSMEAPSCKH